MADEPNLETTETVIEEPKEKTYTEREWKGLLGDKQNETKARQEAQAEAANLRIQIAELREQKTSTVEEDTGDPEDVATNAILNKKIARLEKKLVDMYTKEKTEQTKAEQEKSKAEREKLLEKSLKTAREKYSAEKVGKGLTFDEVNEGTARMVADNKIYGQLIMNDKNPAEKAYEIGLLDPVIAKRYETYKKTLPPGGVTPKEGLDKGTSGAYYTPQMVQKMSDAEIDLHYKDIIESQKKWKTK